jgi:hypothetical protein
MKRRTSVKSRGAPSIASDPQVFQIPLLSHETWITSFYLFAQSQYVLEINKFQAEIYVINMPSIRRILWVIIDGLPRDAARNNSKERK